VLGEQNTVTCKAGCLTRQDSDVRCIGDFSVLTEGAGLITCPFVFAVAKVCHHITFDKLFTNFS